MEGQLDGFKTCCLLRGIVHALTKKGFPDTNTGSDSSIEFIRGM
jgi:hypothetical protein